MKKRLLTVLALFASLAITACGGNTRKSSSAPESSPAPESSSEVESSVAPESSSEVSESSSIAPCSKHTWGDYVETTPATCTVDGVQTRTCSVCGATQEKSIKAGHKWGEWEETTPATCSKEGKQERTCSVCGETEEKDIDKLAHTWDNGVASGNCGEAGKVTYTCTACDATKEETSGYIQHSWEVTGKVDAGDGGLEYNLVKCTKCQKEGLMVAVANSEIEFTSSDSSKRSLKTAPEGCVKLPANNDNFTVTIKLAEAKTGKIYMRGSMDYWYTSSNQNEQKGIYNGQSNGTANKANGIANFKIEYGTSADSLTQVALTADKDLLYKDFLPEEPGFTSIASTDWSQIGDVEVGNVSLAAGLNILKFTRVDSYNLAIHDLVVAFDTVA